MISKALGAAAVPWGLVGLVRGLDRADPTTMNTIVLGAHDEPAHLATSLLVLLAFVGPHRMLAHPSATSTALASSMLIDLDHLPLYLDLPGVAVEDGRPFTHSVPTIATLLGLSTLVRRRRALLASMAAGVGLHFVRDVATGSGLPLWWPWERRLRMLPYRLYSQVLVGLAAIASVRCYRWAAQA